MTNSPDGSQLLTGSGDYTAKLWDLNGNLLLNFVGHSYDIRSVAISPNGNYVLTGSGDHTAKLWDLKDTICKPSPVIPTT